MSEFWCIRKTKRISAIFALCREKRFCPTPSMNVMITLSGLITKGLIKRLFLLSRLRLSWRWMQNSSSSAIPFAHNALNSLLESPLWTQRRRWRFKLLIEGKEGWSGGQSVSHGDSSLRGSVCNLLWGHWEWRVFMYQDNIMMRNQGLGAHQEKHKADRRRLREHQKRAQSVFSSSCWERARKRRRVRCWLALLLVVVHSAICVQLP
jgi:hypothetical protein